MLILTRSEQQDLRIGDEIVIKVLGVRGDQVRIGIHAPREIQILRSEVVDRVRPHPTRGILGTLVDTIRRRSEK